MSQITDQTGTVAGRLAEVRSRMAAASKEAGALARPVELIAVSKTFGEAEILPALRSRAARIRGEPGAGSEGEVARAQGSISGRRSCT